MNRKIFLVLFFSFMFFSFTSAIGMQYVSQINYNEGIINITNVKVDFYSEIKSGYGEFIAEIEGYDFEVLSLTFFDVPNEIRWNGVNNETGLIDDGGIIYLKNVSFELVLPYYENAYKLNIYDSMLNKMAEYDLRKYSKVYKNDMEIEALSDVDVVDKKEILNETVVLKKESKEGSLEVIRDELISRWWIFLVVFLLLLLVLIKFVFF